MAKALIFGINGQDGFYLENHLKEKHIEVIGVSRSAGNWIQGNVSNKEFVENIIQKINPDFVFHLAATSKTSHDLLFEHQTTIVNGTINILESVYNYNSLAKVFITGSGLQFKNLGEPIKETSPFQAFDSYSLARIQSVYAARYYRHKGVRAYVGYLFHHDSPLRTSAHLNQKIAEAAKAAAQGKYYPLSIGDITAEKEFGFAGDIAMGIYHLVQQEVFFEACIGTGKAFTIEKWLELCFNAVGKKWEDFVTINNDFTPDFRKMVSDSSLIHSSGWKPAVTIEELAEMMIKPGSNQ